MLFLSSFSVHDPVRQLATRAEEAAKPPAAPTDEAEDKEVEDWYAKATTPPVPAS